MAGADPPGNVAMEPTRCDSTNVTWKVPEPRVCDGFISGYTVNYRLSSSTGDYTTRNTSGSSVILEDLKPNTLYTVKVAAITSDGSIGANSSVTVHITGT